MIHPSASFVVAVLLVIPSLSIPIKNQREISAHAEELAARDPGFGSFFRKIRKVVSPSNIRKAASVASWVIRDDIPEAYERSLDAVESDELAAREPAFSSFANLETGKSAREDISEFTERCFDSADVDGLSARDFEDLEELAARDPSFGSFFRKIKKQVTPSRIHKVENVAGLFFRDECEVMERDYSELELDQLD
ncbi:hypothetical protein BDZ97DRAFT_1920454 [Flammula alnicola]|nr:hypothetical protein BDZ97DRAFT_1920454 [Flammula alnicola]